MPAVVAPDGLLAPAFAAGLIGTGRRIPLTAVVVPVRCVGARTLW